LVGVSVGRVSWACQLGVPVEPAQAMRLRKSFGWQQCMGALRYEYKFECVLINGRPAAPATVRLELTCRSSARSCTPYWAWRAQRARVCQLGLSVGLVSWVHQLGASVGRVGWACQLGVPVEPAHLERPRARAQRARRLRLKNRAPPVRTPSKSAARSYGGCLVGIAPPAPPPARARPAAPAAGPPRRE
jgi:hypothetical protein